MTARIISLFLLWSLIVLAKKIPFISAWLILISACSMTPSNPTVFPFSINDSLFEQDKSYRLIVASTNFGPPSHSHLRPHTEKVDTAIEKRLKEAGHKIVPNKNFNLAWQKAESQLGKIHDPTTGRINKRKLALVFKKTIQDSDITESADAIIFTDIIESKSQYSGGISHVARWHGVQRKLATQGAGDGVPTDFDWSQQIKVSSLRINIYDLELNHLFHSVGGLDTNSAVALNRSPARFERKRNLLSSKGHIDEGVRLALHPFVVMKKYPQ